MPRTHPRMRNRQRIARRFGVVTETRTTQVDLQEASSDGTNAVAAAAGGGTAAASGYLLTAVSGYMQRTRLSTEEFVRQRWQNNGGTAAAPIFALPSRQQLPQQQRQPDGNAAPSGGPQQPPQLLPPMAVPLQPPLGGSGISGGERLALRSDQSAPTGAYRGPNSSAPPTALPRLSQPAAAATAAAAAEFPLRIADMRTPADQRPSRESVCDQRQGVAAEERHLASPATAVGRKTLEANAEEKTSRRSISAGAAAAAAETGSPWPKAGLGAAAGSTASGNMTVPDQPSIAGLDRRPSTKQAALRQAADRRDFRTAVDSQRAAVLASDSQPSLQPASLEPVQLGADVEAAWHHPKTDVVAAGADAAAEADVAGSATSSERLAAAKSWSLDRPAAGAKGSSATVREVQAATLLPMQQPASGAIRQQASAIATATAAHGSRTARDVPPSPPERPSLPSSSSQRLAAPDTTSPEIAKQATPRGSSKMAGPAAIGAPAAVPSVNRLQLVPTDLGAGASSIAAAAADGTAEWVAQLLRKEPASDQQGPTSKDLAASPLVVGIGDPLVADAPAATFVALERVANAQLTSPPNQLLHSSAVLLPVLKPPERGREAIADRLSGRSVMRTTTGDIRATAVSSSVTSGANQPPALAQDPRPTPSAYETVSVIQSISPSVEKPTLHETTSSVVESIASSGNKSPAFLTPKLANSAAKPSKSSGGKSTAIAPQDTAAPVSKSVASSPVKSRALAPEETAAAADNSSKRSGGKQASTYHPETVASIAKSLASSKGNLTALAPQDTVASLASSVASSVNKSFVFVPQKTAASLAKSAASTGGQSAAFGPRDDTAVPAEKSTTFSDRKSAACGPQETVVSLAQSALSSPAGQAAGFVTHASAVSPARNADCTARKSTTFIPQENATSFAAQPAFSAAKSAAAGRQETVASLARSASSPHKQEPIVQRGTQNSAAPTGSVDVVRGSERRLASPEASGVVGSKLKPAPSREASPPLPINLPQTVFRSRGHSESVAPHAGGEALLPTTAVAAAPPPRPGGGSAASMRSQRSTMAPIRSAPAAPRGSIKETEEGYGVVRWAPSRGESMRSATSRTSATAGGRPSTGERQEAGAEPRRFGAVGAEPWRVSGEAEPSDIVADRSAPLLLPELSGQQQLQRQRHLLRQDRELMAAAQSDIVEIPATPAPPVQYTTVDEIVEGDIERWYRRRGSSAVTAGLASVAMQSGPAAPAVSKRWMRTVGGASPTDGDDEARLRSPSAVDRCRVQASHEESVAGGGAGEQLKRLQSISRGASIHHSPEGYEVSVVRSGAGGGAENALLEAQRTNALDDAGVSDAETDSQYEEDAISIAESAAETQLTSAQDGKSGSSAEVDDRTTILSDGPTHGDNVRLPMGQPASGGNASTFRSVTFRAPLSLSGSSLGASSITETAAPTINETVGSSTVERQWKPLAMSRRTGVSATPGSSQAGQTADDGEAVTYDSGDRQTPAGDDDADPQTAFDDDSADLLTNLTDDADDRRTTATEEHLTGRRSSSADENVDLRLMTRDAALHGKTKTAAGSDGRMTASTDGNDWRTSITGDDGRRTPARVDRRTTMASNENDGRTAAADDDGDERPELRNDATPAGGGNDDDETTTQASATTTWQSDAEFSITDDGGAGGASNNRNNSRRRSARSDRPRRCCCNGCGSRCHGGIPAEDLQAALERRLRSVILNDILAADPFQRTAGWDRCRPLPAEPASPPLRQSRPREEEPLPLRPLAQPSATSRLLDDEQIPLPPRQRRQRRRRRPAQTHYFGRGLGSSYEEQWPIRLG